MGTARRTYPKWVVYALGLFALGMTVLSSVTSREHHSAENARNDALSRLVALESSQLQSSDPSLAMQLALVAYRLSGTPEARAALLDTTAGEMPTRLLGPAGRTAIALGDDGHRLAVAYRSDGQLKLYAVRFAQLRWLATVPAGSSSIKVDSVAISHSGRLVATGDQTGKVTLWSLTSPAHPRRLATLRAGSGAVNGLSFSPGAGALASADADGTVQRWSLADPAQPAVAAALLAPGRPALEAVSYSHDGNTVAAAGGHGTLLIWRAHAGTRPLARITAGTAALTAVAYSPDGHTLAAGGRDGVTHLWTLSSAGRPVAARAPLTGAGAVSSLAFSRDGRYLAAGESDDAVRIWATATWSQAATLPHSATVTGVAFTSRDRHVVSSDGAGTTVVWRFPPPSTFTTGSPVTALSYAPDTPRLTVTGGRGASARWDVVDEWRPAPAGSWWAPPASAVPTGAYGTTTSTTSSTATTSGTSTTSAPGTPAVNPHAGDVALRRTRSATTVLSSALNPTGQLFAAAGTDHQVWLWDVSDPAHPTLLARLGGFTRWVTSVVFSGQSQTLFAAGADHTVRIWDLTNPKDPVQLGDSPLVGPSSAITELALSPDSHTLAAATADGHVWLWAVASPQKASLNANLSAAGGRLDAVAFSPSDNTLVVGGSEGRLTFWHYRPYQAVDRICALAGTPITTTEWQQYVPGVSYDPPCQNWKPPAQPSGGASH